MNTNDPAKPLALTRRQFCGQVSLASVAFGNTRALAALLPGQSGKSASADFYFANDLGIPFYAWPRTLLKYAAPASMRGARSLFCAETGEFLPFQNIAARDGEGECVVLFSDLPPGTSRTFKWSSAPASSNAARVTATAEDNSIVIDTGAVRVRIPATQTIHGEVPGPLLQMSRGEQWVGNSTLRMTGTIVRSITTEQLEAGPLRSVHRISYITASDARYRVTVRAVAGEPDISLQEDMESFPDSMHGEFRFTWTGLPFTVRQSPNHPYQFPSRPLQAYELYPWEAISPAQMDSQFGVVAGIGANGRLPFNLRVFEPWQDVKAASFANFRCAQGSDAAAIFIDHMEEWNDHEYAIWRSSSKLSIDFEYDAPDLTFVWKLGRGTRSATVAYYDHERDREAMRIVEEAARGVTAGGQHFSTSIFPSSYGLYTQNWQSTLSLDRVKDWVMRYSRSARRPQPLFKECEFSTADQLYQSITTSGFVLNLALSGTRQNHGFGATGSRILLDGWIPGYQIFRDALTTSQQQRVEAILLMLAYVHAGEDYMPMRYMLAGHPNFLSDVKSVPPGIAFLFPDHPASESWRAEWEAYLRLNTRYHTRPAVEAWDARGGRWTENLGTYVWAFLRPASRAAFLMKQQDGVERLCTPQLAMMGDWLVNALSAPFNGESADVFARLQHEMSTQESARRHYWGLVRASDHRPRRVHPPIGAHSERRKTPRTMWYLGHALRCYAPMTAEHLMWAARPDDQDMEVPLTAPDPYRVMFTEPDNRGTNPHLRSAKYTGFGVTLRAAVDTPQEVSVHLMQIDDGQNYRWGNAAEGSCGVVYYFADGKGWSHNGGEDTGDRIDQDTDFGSIFGVWKGDAFRSIGQNVLTEPLYDLHVAQAVRLLPRQGASAYSWPEYQSRTVLLAGSDYFVLHDRVFNPQIAHRFSWFVRKGDAFPALIPLLSPRAQDWTTLETEQTSGRWIDGTGDSLVLVSHHADIAAEPIAGGARVTLPDGEDFLFASAHPVRFTRDDMSFSGSYGLLRKRSATTAFALFEGESIAVPQLAITIDGGRVAIAGEGGNGGFAGHFDAGEHSSLWVAIDDRPATRLFHIDGVPAETFRESGGLRIALPAGRHTWEVTAGNPEPPQPDFLHSESTRGGAILRGGPVRGATQYEFAQSEDDGATWSVAGAAPQPMYEMHALVPGRKYHVRMRAINGSRTGPWCDETPVYSTDQPPSPPDGLSVELTPGGASVTWGRVLGVTGYRLYRRAGAAAAFTVVYDGTETAWHDPAPHTAGAVAAYRVAAVSHIGAGVPSRIMVADPASWRTWNPTGNEPYRRTEQRTLGPLPNDGIGRYYPAG